ncbi:hypothetical protein IW261DRAFT_1484063 [Armillaria novae-zelandiae]|uniref:Uncharacterized protein n=1 Tax=Armillaria novae-zelandiae TaxID=153914 RepID=A0AA39P562_9AGAR|nr:hypothetical protein IW261DRAFT_1484063 [Armillaria novae-zelandiae]
MYPIKSVFQAEICLSSAQMANRRRHSRVLCCFLTSLAFVIVVPTLWIDLLLRLPPSSTSGISNTTVWDASSKSLSRTIILQADVVSVDILQTTMVTEWSIIGDTCINPDVNNNCTAINIFFDTNFSPSDPRHDNGPYSNNRPTDPIFIWNATDFGRGRTNFNSNSLTFRAELTLFTNDVSYLSAYPFDSYYADIIIFAQDVLTNDSVSVNLSTSYGLITGIKTTTDAVECPSWRPENYSLPFLQGLQGAIHIYTNLQRSPLVIAYCLIITITFWMVTLVICLIMIATVFFGFRQRNEIVVVPIGTVFAFTQLRASMPGAPDGFGDILDFAGLLPCLVLLSISAITMVGIYLFADPDDPSRRAFTWSELKDTLHYYIQNVWDTCKDLVQRARFRVLSARWKRKGVSQHLC